MKRRGNIAGWNGPYLKGGLKNDPWGSPYSYQCDGSDPNVPDVLGSAGPDKRAGTSDDITD